VIPRGSAVTGTAFAGGTETALSAVASVHNWTQSIHVTRLDNVSSMRAPVVVGFLIFGVLAAAAAVLTVVFMPFLDRREAAADLAVTEPLPGASVAVRAQYLPPRAAEAPEAIRAQVLKGQQVMTARYQNGTSFRHISCSSCHFSGGLTEGGTNNGFSLVGAAALIPTDGTAVALEHRLVECFRVNLNLPPPGGDGLTAIATYLRWISKGVPLSSQVPWLQIQPLSSLHVPDPKAGARVWHDTCSPCHGDNGEGTRIAPATYGPESYTTGSPMLHPGILERFIKDNMPRGNPTLAEDDAIDVAAHLREQPRPLPGP
jgi:thiosulfate dehydrogenase